MTVKMRDDNYMTVVFKCDVKSFKGNPFHRDTPFGRPVAISPGNALSEIDLLEDEIEGLYRTAAGADI